MISSLLAGLQSNNSNLKYARITFRGEVKGIPAIVTPDLTLLRNDRSIGYIRVKQRKNLKIYDSDYAGLQLAGYLDDEEETRDYEKKLIVVAYSETSGLVEALKRLLETGIYPAKEEKWAIGIRVYDRYIAEEFLLKAINVLVRDTPPIPRVSPRCNYCSLREECPAQM
ncbi:MAG: hypothetical protein GSR77_00925 [Desulfurococcales archaeon]|nr:hypothetical protein [Desulfurococcales archaeon]